MNRRRLIRMIRSMTFVLAVIPLIALANSYDWNGPSGAFNDENKWTPNPSFCLSPDCYPQTCNDDAIMVIDGGATVTISTQTIDDLTLSPAAGIGDVIPEGGGGAPQTLTCDTLTINLANLGGRALSLENNAVIKTAGCP